MLPRKHQQQADSRTPYIQGRHIDHAYLLDPTGKVHPIIERYSPYYSDHDGICIVIQNLVNEDKDDKQ